MGWARTPLGACGLLLALTGGAAAAPGAVSFHESLPEAARGAALVRDGVPQVRASLLLHPDDLPPGESMRVGLLLELEPGWHTYGPEPGDSGLPPELDWKIEGARVGPTEWPPTSRFLESNGEIETFGYSGRVLLASRVVLEAGAPRPRRVSLDARVLVCEHECVPVRFALERALSAPSDPRVAALERRLFGRVAAGPSMPVLAALGLALLGGLLLNLMPCVLPVLAIKVFAVTELASRSRREARVHGMAYAAGVLFSMAGLAALVVGLRAAGHSVGWGFQFQEPLFVVAISALLLVFAMNLFGVFEIGAPRGLGGIGAGASGARRSFSEGLLAVALATPCTAPFLGAAVGFAFAAPAPWVFACFAAIGAGLAAPFVAVTFAPGWARWLPRSGPWMRHLRAALGFALLGTLVWLVWVFGRGTGVDGVGALLVLLLVLALGVWIYGILQAGRPPWLPWAAALGVAALVLAAPGLVRLEPVQAPRPGPDAEPRAEWQPYTADAVAAELARGRPAFVSFTADWCITCKVNERLVLADERVRGLLRQRGFALFRADWTRRDEAIRAELARFGRAGVPLYLIYRPEEPAEPELLPELLTVNLVVDALRGVSSPSV